MNNESQDLAPAPAPAPARTITVKIFGVGTAGVHMTEQMLKGDFGSAAFVAVNTEASALAATTTPDTLYLQTKLLRGLGTGADPERGRAAAEEHLQKLKDACAGVDVVFIVAGLGGGTGTGISPVLARAAKKAGALTLAFVTLPFDCEGNRRQRLAREGLEQLKAAADGVICLPCQKVFKLIGENTSVVDTFAATSQWLIEGARGVWRLLAHTGLIQIHFADLVGLLRDRHGESCFAAVEAAGTTRSRDAVEKLLAHPMLDAGAALAEADAALVSLMGGPDLTMAEINRVMEQISQQCGKAQIIMGAAVDEAFHERLSVTIIATRHGARVAAKPSPDRSDARAPADDETQDFDSELLHQTTPRRPPSRLVPPTPTLTTEQREEILARHGGNAARQRKRAPRMKQTQLPLEIVTKGRFDRTEPTVHKGEDLDLPTYVRRGVALN
ncbi:MAG: cell division FtsZ family protein [Verrucomicrobia bacterium]|jgi:cell division protein FtsZ|nr:cell division FtsZ family protein [Verrucomicrobiota bacterium]